MDKRLILLCFSSVDEILERATKEPEKTDTVHSMEDSMATVLERPSTAQNESAPTADLNGFLAALGELSRQYGIAIGDGASLYLMEREDYARSYVTSDASELSFD